MHKLTRISFNSGGWRQPTGDARKSETSGTYNREHGFGHEDWLFRDEWQIDGWRYAFIEGVNKSHRKLVKDRVPIDLTLFTIQPNKRRRYVALIRAVECLDDQQAEGALNYFKERGWYGSMLEEIKSADGEVAALGDAKWAKHILNVRFRLENLSRFGPAEFIQANDPAMRYSRYMLYDAGSLPQRPRAEVPRQRQGSATAPSTHAFARRATPATQCEPEHARMQAKLLAELRKEYPGARIVREENFIDVSVDTAAKLFLYEIKSDLEPRVAIR